MQAPSLEGQSYIRSLFDFSFSSLVTRRVIKVLYVLITVLYSLFALISFIFLLAHHSASDLLVAIIGVPLAYLIYLTLARISLEVLMVIFGIGEDVRVLRERAGGEGTTPLET